MKKYLILLICCLLFVGCGNYNSKEAMKDFKNKLDKAESYNLIGTMEIMSNQEKYLYDVNVSYKEGDYYKVNLINTENSHEQIILKNEDGVYVVTPALNKSFKFQSEWPHNSSQTYILKSLLNDIEKDSNKVFKEEKGKYIFTTKVNYPSNSNLVSQKITFNKKMDLEKVEVLNTDNKPLITLIVTGINWKTDYEEEYFSLNNSVDENCCNDTETSSEIDEIIYPMYLPTGTSFKDEEIITTNGVDRVILTFTGEKPFIMIEEISSIPKQHQVVSAPGELIFYETILGSITDTSLNWTKNGVDYYIIGQNLTEEEILQIASSTSTVALTK